MKFLSTLFSRPMMVFLGRLLAHPLDQLKKVRQARRDALCIARSGLFDGAWYLGRYSDVADSGLHPLVHYVRRGAYEGRDPNPLFNSRWYLEKNPEVKADGGNPLAHFIRYGVPMGLNPSAYFDLDWYLAQNKSAITAGMHPLRYFLEAGVARGSRPSRHVTALSRWMKDGKNDRLPRVLMIDRIYPRPDRDSGSIDCMNYIGLFREFGYRVFFAADEEYNIDPEIHEPLERRDVLCLNPADFLTIERFIESEMDGFSAAFLSRVFSGGRFYEAIRKKNPKVKIIFNTVDLHAIREMREANVKEDARLLKRALNTIKRERFLAEQCDATIILSDFERKYLSEKVPDEKLFRIPHMRDCPGTGRGFTDRAGICFIGSYLHSPNVDALLYFLKDIWPLILDKKSHYRFYIIGSDLPEHIRTGNFPNVEILGYVPDLKNCLDGMRLSVAPLRFGAGVKGKVVTSLAHGLPCVATDIAVEGMGLVKDIHICVENKPAAFADRVIQLHEDRETWTRLSDTGWKFCMDELSYSKGRQRMVELLMKLKLHVRDINRHVHNTLT